MCKNARPTTARSLRSKPKLGTENLVKPIVPIADAIDGLVKTADLASDVAVMVTIWPGATENDEIRLRLNGEVVGDLAILGPDPEPGETIQIDIPIASELLQDGIYTLEYVVDVFPGGNATPSPTLLIQIDRTPPGLHQLGYMDFPEEAKNGLTAEELSSMGDVLTGRIYGYTGLTKGDIIKTYWGNAAGPELMLSGTEDGSAPIEINFEKDFLLSLDNDAGATYYTVTDRAGNISSPSKMITIPLFLTEVVSDLPPPVVEDLDGVIDYLDAIAGVGVKIPSSAFIASGDAILLRWGTVSYGPIEFDPADIAEPYILQFNVSFAGIQEAGDGLRQIKYEVIRAERVVGVSEPAEIGVQITLPVPGLLNRPTIKGASSTPNAEDNVIDENDFELDATVIISWNMDFSANQVIRVNWGGTEVLEAPYTITNSDVAAARSLILTAKVDKFKPVGTGNDIRVNYTVSATDNPNLSVSAEQGIVVISKDELPGGPEGPQAPQFTQLNQNGAINDETAADGAPVYIEPYKNILAGQIIVFSYEAYDDLVSGNLKFVWTHTSPALTEDAIVNGYHFLVPRSELQRHCFGHVEATFKVKSDKGQGNSGRTSAYVDMRHAGVCSS